ncbi:hypothetical protein BH11CYA1_BH11CYA1_41930 [soil metagenome]
MANFIKSKFAGLFEAALIIAILSCANINIDTNSAAYAAKSSSLEMNFAQGQLALNNNQIDKCKQYIAILKTENAGAIQGTVLEARLLSKQGHFKEAIALLNQTLKSNANSATLLTQRAQVYGYLDDEKQSCADYYAASKCSNMSVADCSIIVEGLKDYDKWEDALAVAQIGMKAKSPTPSLCSNAADVARRLNKLDLAEQYIEKALSMGFAKASLFQELASIHKVMKKWPAVISDCKRLKQQVPNADGHLTYARCLEMSGEAHIELKQYEEAIADLTVARKISPLKATVLKTRAIAYTKLGKNVLAQKDLAEAKQIDNSF